MRNENLETNQQETYNQVSDTFSFTCSGAGAATQGKAVMQALLPGIRLHFLRYGYIKKKSGEDVGFCINGPESRDKYSVDEMDSANGDIQSTDNFYVARTALREGFIYLINNDDKNDFHELSVNVCGGMAHVLWGAEGTLNPDGSYSDIRKATREDIHYKLINPNKKMWVAFSTVQWSIDYHTEMLNDEEKRSEQMILIDCTGIKKGEETANEHALPYSEIKVAHYKDHPNHHRLRNELRQIKATEIREDERGDNEILEDMFITFHDPIGVANDIANLLDIEIIRQKALLESIQTGRNLEPVFNRMLRGEKSPTPSSQEEQIGAMVNLALSQYKLIYDSDEMIDDYDGGDIGWGGGVYKPKLLNILGVEKRKDQRDIIRKLQDELGTFLKKDYYKDSFHAFENGSTLNSLDGKVFATYFYQLLAIKPHQQDKAFDLKKHEEIDTKWDYLIIESLQEAGNACSVYNVLNKDVQLDEETIKQGVDVANKFAAFVKISLETYSKFAIEDITRTESKTQTVKQIVKGKYKLTVNRLNKIKVYGEEMFEVRGYEVRQQIQTSGWVIDNGKVVAGSYSGGKDLYRWITTASPELVLKETSRGHHVFDIPVVKEVEEIIRTKEYASHKQPTKLGTKATAVLDGLPFRGVVALLQVFNIGAAFHTLSQDLSIKNSINLFGIGAELTAASSLFLEKALGTSLKEAAIKSIGKIAYRANIVGSGVTVIMCTWEACLSFDARDKDAALAWSGAAAAFTGATIAAIFASASWAGPVGWVCAGVGVGLVFLAYYLKDTPLETFFKNNAFSDEVDFIEYEGEDVGEYNKSFYLNRNTICSDTDFQKWNDFKLAGAELTDLIVSSAIHFNPKQLINKVSSSTGLFEAAVLGKHETVDTGFIKKFEIGISFRQFLQSEDQLAYKFYFFKDGINETYEEIEIEAEIRIEEASENIPPLLILNFEIPSLYTNQYNQNSALLLVSALSLGDNKFYPSQYNNETRFLGAYASVFQAKTTKTTRMGQTTRTALNRSNIAIQPLEKLLSGSAW